MIWSDLKEVFLREILITVQDPQLATYVTILIEFKKSQAEASNLSNGFLMMNPHKEDEHVWSPFVFRMMNLFYLLFCLAVGQIPVVLF